MEILDPSTRILTFPQEIIMGMVNTAIIVSNKIDWNNVTWILILIGGYYMIKKIMSKRAFMRMGMTTKNMLVFANMKNYVNGMEETQRKIYENMFHEILMSDDLEGEITAIENAADELHTLMIKKHVGEQHAGL